MKKFAVFFLWGMTACSTIDALKSPSSDYRDYVETNLMKAELYDAGRQMVVLKVLHGNTRLKTLQEELAPGFGFDKKEEVYQLVVALSLAHPGGFSVGDLKVSLADHDMLSRKEISGSALLETLYFYAYPYQRVFVMDFPKEVEGLPEKNLRLKTPRGEVTLMIKESPQ